VPKSYAAKIISLDKANNIFERADQRGLKSILQIEMLRVQLVECNDRGTFCIEAALRARLWNIAGQVLLYDAVHYYSTNFVRTERPFYESNVSTSSECRKMDLYCSPDGPALLKRELTQAMQYSIKSILNDLKLAQ